MVNIPRHIRHSSFHKLFPLPQYQEAYHDVRKENDHLKDQVSQRDIRIRVLELEIEKVRAALAEAQLEVKNAGERAATAEVASQTASTQPNEVVEAATETTKVETTSVATEAGVETTTTTVQTETEAIFEEDAVIVRDVSEI